MIKKKSKKPAQPLSPEHYLVQVQTLVQNQRIDSISKLIFELNKTLQDLRASFDARETEESNKIEELGSSLALDQANLTLTLAKLKNEIQDLIEFSIESAKGSLDKSEEITSLKSSLQDLSSKVSVLNKSFINIEKDILLDRANDSSESEIADLSDKLQIMQDKIASLQSELKNTRSKIVDPMTIISQIKFPVQRSLSIPVAIDEGGTGLTNNNYHYFGGSPSNPSSGMWRFSISGTDLIAERYESGSWVNKGGFTA